MKLHLFAAVSILAAGSQFAYSEEPDFEGKQVQTQLVEREQKITQLSTQEQLKFRAAQVKAAEDPEVIAALEKRNKAIEEFRKALHDSMVKADPKLEEILQKVAVGASPGF